MEPETLAVIRSRRVVRDFTAQPVPDAILWKILEAARWAPAGSNRRVQRYICLTDSKIIHQVKLVSPGMVVPPPALIVICVDWSLVAATWSSKCNRTMLIDVGTAAENMLLAAHALGLGGWPMTSSCQEAVRILLNIPANLSPLMFIGIGYPSPPSSNELKRPKKRIRVEDLVQWGPFGGQS